MGVPEGMETMTLVLLKCPNCGAGMTVEVSDGVWGCPYCRSIATSKPASQEAPPVPAANPPYPPLRPGDVGKTRAEWMQSELALAEISGKMESLRQQHPFLEINSLLAVWLLIAGVFSFLFTCLFLNPAQGIIFFSHTPVFVGVLTLELVLGGWGIFMLVRHRALKGRDPERFTAVLEEMAQLETEWRKLLAMNEFLRGRAEVAERLDAMAAQRGG